MVRLCESCEERKIAAKVELDSKTRYLCRLCTEAIQEQNKKLSLCETCHSAPTVVTLIQNDNTIVSVCGSCKDTIPKKKSKSKSESSIGLTFGIASEQGRRPTMEDAETAIADLTKHFPEHAPKNSSFFAVYDGHGGQRAADFVAETLHSKIVATQLFSKGNYNEAIIQGYSQTDTELLKVCDAGKWTDGATAVVGILVDNQLITSCVGDSELVVCVNGKAECRSFKHKPNEPSELARIREAKGVVLFGRLGASMAVSRSFGDVVHKYPYNDAQADHMSAEPYIDTMDASEIEFMIVACDGLWDNFEYQDAVDFVLKKRKKNKSAQDVATAIVEEALERGSSDNVTAIIVYLK